MPNTQVHGRKALTINPPPPPLPSGDVVIEVTFASNPAVASAAVADLKYDKQGVFNFEFDDRSPNTRDAYAYFHGGVAPINATSYPGKTFTDGCGNNIKWRGAIATNAKLQGDDSDWVNYNSCLSWSELANLINNDWMVENHGYYHNKTGTFANGEDTVKNIHDNTKYIFTNLQGQGVPYRSRVFVIPNADTGYILPAEDLGYLVSITQGDRDGYICRPEFSDQPLTLAALTNGTYALLNRSFKDGWDAAAVTYYNGVIDNVYSGMAGTSQATKKIWRLGGHYFDAAIPAEFSSWRSVMDHLETVSADRIWVTSAQELYEYLEMKRLAIINQSISGNKLTISISFANVPANNRFRDMSFVVTSDVNVTSVNVTGADSNSYNTGTKLINIFKKKTTGFVDPSIALTTPVHSISTTSGDRFTVAWSSVLNATGYTIQVATDSIFTQNVQSFTTSNLSYVVTGRSATTTYYVRIFATALGYNDSPISGNISTTTGSIINLNKGGDGGIFITAPVAGATYTIDANQNPYDYIYFGNPTTVVGGASNQRIIVKNINGQVSHRAGFKLENAKFIDVTGTGTIGTTYGFKSSDPANLVNGGGAIEVQGLTHDCSAEWMDADQKTYLALVKNEASFYPCDTSYWFPAIMYNLKFTNLRGTNIHQDGVYDGSSAPYGGREISCTPTTSNSNFTIPTTHPSARNFTVATGLSTNAQTGYANSQLVEVTDTVSGNSFRGNIASYNSGTGLLQLNTISNIGTASSTSWTVKIIIAPRPAGLQNVEWGYIILDNVGRSGFQCGGTDGLRIHHSNVTNCGFTLDIQQGAGIAIGSACTNVEVDHNFIDYTFKFGIYGYHYGLANIHHNTIRHSGIVKVSGVDNINSNINSLFFNTFDILNPSATRVILSDNDIGTNTSSNGKALLLYTGNSTFDYATDNILCNNLYLGVAMIDSDIDKSQVLANGNTFNYTGCP